MDKFLEAIKQSEEELYRRRPFSKEPAKMLWELCSRMAGRLTHLVLAPWPSESSAKAFLKLHSAIDSLCNRWIGFDQPSEAKVLAHSFEASFLDSTAIVLIARRGLPFHLGELRTFLLQVIQRRLVHSDPMVPLER